jgi:hypothetical protein
MDTTTLQANNVTLPSNPPLGKMAESLVEMFAFLVVNILMFGYVALAAYIIDTHLVQRRERVVRVGRRVQNLLHLPGWMRVFTETDPGMLNKDIRSAAQGLSWSVLIAFFGFLVALTKGTIWDPWVLSLGFAIPFSMNILIWLELVYFRRRLARRLESERLSLVEHEGYAKERAIPTVDPGEGDWGLEEYIRLCT